MPAEPTRQQVEERLRAVTATPGWAQRRWGQQHTRAFPHPLLRDFDLGPVERSGGAGTIEADGATYREILDVADWDRSQAINVPGQSGQPRSPYYDNLLEMWADNEYFPLAFSQKAVSAAAAHRLTLRPSR
jgi:penicillin amidase